MSTLIERNELKTKIEEKEKQLYRVSQESNSRNSGKLKSSGMAQISKVLEGTLRKELNSLNSQLAKLT
jgi:hypothetical protein